MVWIKSPNADLGDVAGDPKQTVANKAEMLGRSDFVSLLNQMKLFGARLQKKRYIFYSSDIKVLSSKSTYQNP